MRSYRIELDQLCDEGVRRHVDHLHGGLGSRDFLADGLDQMCLAEAGASIEEGGNKSAARIFGDGEGGGIGQLVGACGLTKVPNR